MCLDDAFEDNDDPGSPWSLAAGAYPALMACPLDTDYFAVTLAAFDEITVDLTFLTAEGDIDLYLADPSGAVVASSTTLTDDESVGPFTATIAGEWLVVADLYADAGVFPGNDYDLDIAVVAASCTDDSFEDNDTDTTPTVIGAGSYTSLVSCPTDDDWYSIPLLAGDEITVDLTFANAEGDLDVRLYDPTGATVALGNTTTDDESVSHTAGAGGDFLILVEMYADGGAAPGNDYDMTTGVTVAPTCIDDGFEDNDTDLSPAPIIAGAYSGLQTCPSDDDYFSVALTAGDEITVDLFFADAEGDVDLRLFDPSGALVGLSVSTTDDESIGSVVAAADGDYLIRINLAVDDGVLPGNSYDLDVQVLEYVPVCVDDFFEDNDTDTTAAGVIPGVYPGLQACDGDDDWYSVTLAIGDEIDAEVLFGHAEGDIDLYLYDPSGTMVDFSNSSSDDEAVGPYTAAADGDHLVKVELYTDTGALPGNGYDLEIGVVQVVPECFDDAFEDNDSDAAAFGLGAGTYAGLASCPLDDDYYAVTLATNDELTVDLSFADTEGDVDMYLLDPAGTVVASATSTTDDESIAHTAASDGDYLVWVLLAVDDGVDLGNTYDMAVGVVEYIPPCVDDSFEDNDTEATANSIVAGTYSPLQSCDGDDDYYAIALGVGDTLDVELFFADAEGDIDLSLIDPAGTIVGLSTSTDDNEALSWVAAADGDHLVRVTLYLDDGATPGNAYDMTLALTPAPVCIDDALEDNDTDATAAGITDGSYSGLQSCEADDDYYAIALDVGDTIEVDLFFADDEGDIDLRLLDPALTTVQLSLSTDDDEAVAWTATTAGTHLIRVNLAFDDGVDPGNPYDMDVAVTLACVDDGFEDNDSALTASFIAPGVFPDLGSCPSDDDYYSIPLFWGDELMVDLFFANAEGDIDVELVDPTGVVVADSQSSDDDEFLTWTSTLDGTYLIRVWLFADQGVLLGNAYDLDIGLVPFTPTCVEDIYEDNDAEVDATPVTVGGYPSLASCPSDDDYFAIELLAGDVLDVDLTFDNGEGDIDLDILDPSGAVVISSNTSTDDEAATWTAATSGEHYILVSLFADAGDPTTPGNVYDLTVGMSLAACVDDSYEDNDTDATAAAIGDGVYPGLGACPTDDDYYAVALLTGDEITVDLAFATAEGDIDLELLDPSGALLASSTSITDDESLGPITTATGGDFLVRVFLYSDAGPIAGNAYDMTVTLGAADCIDDAFEDNDTDATPAPVTDGNYPDLGACPADGDYYSIDLLIGDELTVDLGFADDEGDIDLEILDPSLAVVASSGSTDDDESATWTATAGGTHVIRAWLFSDAGLVLGNPYTMDVTLASAECVDDSFEDNDTDTTAAAVTAGAYPGLGSCPSDDDWFGVDLLTGDVLDLFLAFSHAEGDIDLELFDPTGVWVSDSLSATDDEAITYTAVTGGTFLARVFLESDTGSVLGNSYDMDVAVTAAICVDDSYEDNDTDAAASVLAAGAYSGLGACPTDEDWYAVDGLLIGDVLDVDLYFADAEGDIDVQLYSPSMVLVDSGTSATDDEAVSATAGEAGTFFVMAWLFSDDGVVLGNSYDMDIALTPADCADDGFEDNDTDTTPSGIVAGSHTGLGSCPTDDDWYAIDLLTGDELTVELWFSDAEGDIDLELFDPSGADVASSETGDDNEDVGPYTVAADGTHLIHVWLFSDGGDVLGNSYDMDITLVPFVPTCLADLFEANDSDAAATPLAPNTDSYPALTACPTDDDWYAIPMLTGDVIDVDVLFIDAAGDVDLRFFDPTLAQVADSESSTDNEDISWTAAVDGLHYIRIWLFSESDALPGNAYDLDVTYTQADCIDDSYEDNDTDTTPSAVTGGNYPDLASCPSDDDYYSVPLLVGDELSADLSFIHADGDIDVQLIDPSGAVLDTGGSLTDDESVGPITAAVAGDFQIRVYLFGESDAVLGNDYEMDVTLVTAACIDDTLEDNDTTSNPTAIIPTAYAGLVSCPTDDDYYAIDLLTGDEITVGLAFVDIDGDIDLRLLNPSGTVVASSLTTDDDESLTYTTVTGGEFLVRVSMYLDAGPVIGNDYTMDVSVVEAECFDDIYEDNDTDLTPVTMAPGSYADLGVCLGDDDYYAVPLLTNDEISVDLFFLHAEGDIDLRLYNPAGGLVASSLSVDNDESLGPVTALVDGEFQIRVNLLTDTGVTLGNTYEMDIDVVEAPPPCLDDSFEENDTDAAAAGVGIGVEAGLMACPTDDDWYVIDLLPGDTLTVDLTFAHAEGDVDLELFDDPTASRVVWSTSSTDNESITWVATTAGPHLIRAWLFADYGVLPGNIYDLEVGLTLAPCVDDAEEDNDTQATAGVAPLGLTTDLMSCSTVDDDYYAVTMAIGDEITAEILFLDAEGDLDLYLIDPNGTNVDNSTSFSDDELVGPFTATVAGDHFIRVHMYADAGVLEGNPYDMDVTLVLAPPPACLPDSYEENDIAGAAPTVTAGNYPALTACPSDEDWYAVDLLAGDTYTVDLTFIDVDGDIDLELFNPSVVEVAQSVSATDDESATWVAAVDGTHYVRAWLFSDDAVPGNAYEMDITVTLAPCLDDLLEENDTSGAALAVGPGPNPGLVTCPTDEDWYSIDLLVGDELTVDLAFVDAFGDVDLEIYDDPAATRVAFSTSASDDESASWVATTGGTHFIRVWLFLDAGPTLGNDYDMGVSLTPAGCIDDPYENNDGWATATDVTVAGLSALAVCPSDHDWYTIDLLTGDQITVDLTFVDAEGDIDLYLFEDATSPSVASSASTSDNESASWTVTQDGPFYIQAFFYADAGAVVGNTYDLGLTVTLAACVDDTLEENDSDTAAVPVGPGLTPDLVTCPTDDDWYTFDLFAGDEITVDALFLDAEGDIDLELYFDPTAAALEESDSSTDNESVTHTAATAGTYYIKVWLYADAGVVEGNAYDLDVTLTAVSCVDDLLEENDTDADAEPVADGSYANLMACPGPDFDWYEIELLTGDEITVDLTFFDAEGDVDLRLFQDPTTPSVASSLTTTDDESLTYTAVASATHYVRVHLHSDDGALPGNTYAMDIGVTLAPCVDDSWEDNDVFGDAGVVPTGLTTGLSACPGPDYDWYAIDLFVGDEITVDALFVDAEGDIDLYLYDDPAASAVDSSATTSDNEQVTWTATTGGTHYMRAHLYGDAGVLEGNPYNLDVTVVGATCAEDSYEDNDVFSAAAPLGDGSYSSLRACPTDNDWYAVDLLAGDTISVDLFFSDAEGDIDLVLRSPSNSFLLSSGSSTDNESVGPYVATTDGAYLVRAWLYSDDGAFVGNDYDMDITVTLAPCVDDGEEENDTDATASGLAPGLTPGLTTCPSDDDWYSIFMYVGDELEVDALFSDAEGDIDLELYDPGLVEVDDSTSASDNETVGPYTATVAGDHYVRAWLYLDAGVLEGNTYDLDVTLTPAGCPDDTWEENDTSAAAAGLSAGTYNGLAACPGPDYDWYAVDLLAGDTLNVDLTFSDAEGDIDLRIYNPAVTSVASSLTTSDNESASFVALVDGTHYVRAWLHADDGSFPGNDYNMVVGVLLAPCADDTMEDNDTDATSALVADGSYNDLVTCPSDDDWYGVYLWEGDELTVDLFFTDATGDIDLSIDDPDGNWHASSGSTTDDESATVVADENGLWLVRAYLYGDAGPFLGNDYDMDISVTCGDDPFEDNDSAAGLAEIPPSYQPNLRLCPTDADWYGVYMETGDTLTVDLFFAHAEGDIDLTLYNPAGGWVASSGSSSDNEMASYTATTSGVHQVRVYLYADYGDYLGNGYDMDAHVDAANPWCAAGDFFDPNDSIAAASSIDLGVEAYYALSLCNPVDDDDYFEVPLAANETLDVDIWFSHATADVDLFIRDASGLSLDGSASSTDNEDVSYTAGSSAETVYIHVEMWSYLGENSYDMDVLLTP